MIYAAGIEYMLMAFIFLLIGIPVFIAARRQTLAKADAQTEEKIFTGNEKIAVYIIAVVCIAAIALYATGVLKL